MEPTKIEVPGLPEPRQTSAREPDAAFDGLADAICRRGLAPCALFMLETVKPLNFIGSQLMYGLGPIASLVFDRDKWEELAHTLEDREAIERLMQRIEERERRPSPRN